MNGTFDGTTYFVELSDDLEWGHEITVRDGDFELTLVTYPGECLLENARVNCEACGLDNWLTQRIMYVFGVAHRAIIKAEMRAFQVEHGYIPTFT